MRLTKRGGAIRKNNVKIQLSVEGHAVAVGAEADLKFNWENREIGGKLVDHESKKNYVNYNKT